ncbi:uncharacterized protein APUU_81032A [Aspergillus puulaauensis]|uniref:Uncharacterized protein n=1 Tax=Aspergillus puulaauensis TaxID=1220207 RepID=A0A7R8ASS6_9EURO|nr:uncharacterized protein APUU_81032A [Aspergillus puulaauensis]BCS30729.1 hypothetical protein APUU_81032A [Aspergillus puulaauensis]
MPQLAFGLSARKVCKRAGMSKEMTVIKSLTVPVPAESKDTPCSNTQTMAGSFMDSYTDLSTQDCLPERPLASSVRA